MPPADTLALIVNFDAAVYVGDLPILAFARQCAEQLPEQAAGWLIDGIRFFLEGRTIGGRSAELSERLADVQDGIGAVAVLAGGVGLTAADIAAAHRRSREDVVASAFALEPPAGLIGLLAEFPEVFLTVRADYDVAGVLEVLEVLGLAPHVDQIAGVDEVTGVDRPGSEIPAESRPVQVLAVSNRWIGDLESAAARGATTVLVDRFGRNAGSPSHRISDLSDLAPAVRRWIG